MDQLVDKLRLDNPTLIFKVGAAHCWSPQRGEILYESADTAANMAGILHELGHAQLGHHTFSSDVELLQREVEAWQAAIGLAERYGLTIDEAHIQDCLDTYRDWLYRRSQCPGCSGTGVQHTPHHYMCMNCGGRWRVSSSRLKRPYRRRAASAPHADN